jgi:hypothetical protein
MSEGTSYTVRQGESVESIATQFGHFWQTVWNDPQNADLKAKRKSPHLLFPGDVVFVPALRLRQESLPTGKRTTFKRKGVPSRLRVAFLVANKPRAGAAYVLVVDGVVDQPIDPCAQSATLHFTDDPDDVVYTLDLRYLNPVDTPSGARERLRNLGYGGGDPGDDVDDDLGAALAEFQEDHGMKPTGELDDATRAKLEEKHAC